MHKSVVLKSALKSALPFQPWLRRIKRRWIPYQDDPANSRFALQQGLRLIDLLLASQTGLCADVLEIGTGWLPIVPLLFRLAGARRLILTDVERLMDRQTIARARAVIRANMPAISAVLQKTDAELTATLEADFPFEYRVPWDSRSHPAASADIVFSRAVLEHVPPVVLERLVTGLGRILRPGGVMCHAVDNSDHWEHRDKSLSRLDFLRYEEGWFWRLACRNTQAYQNRLRHSDYLRLFAAHGWTAIVADGTPDERCLRDLETLPLALAFRHYDHQDLAILTSYFVFRRTTECACAESPPVVRWTPSGGPLGPGC